MALYLHSGANVRRYGFALQTVDYSLDLRQLGPAYSLVGNTLKTDLRANFTIGSLAHGCHFSHRSLHNHVGRNHLEVGARDSDWRLGCPQDERSLSYALLQGLRESYRAGKLFGGKAIELSSGERI